MLTAAIERFIKDERTGNFDALVAAALALQCEHIEPIRELCRSHGVGPEEVTSWKQIPLVPVAAFRSLRLAVAEPMAVFRSSGTGGGERSSHYHPFLDLYRHTVDATFPRFCLPQAPPIPILSLIGDRALLPDSSLAFMVDHVLSRWASEGSLTAFTRRGIEVAKARSWLGTHQRAGRPVLVIATALALLELLDALTRVDLRFRLPPGSVVFETGGFKSRTREISRDDLLAMTSERLGVPPQRVVREYGMTELTSQCYTDALAGGDPDLFLPPRWMRVRALDPVSLTEQPAGVPGVLAILDLANVGSALHLLTEDLGSVSESGFRLLGRAAGADLRGCSLVAEEFASL